jgi:hypothetical protein
MSANSGNPGPVKTCILCSRQELLGWIEGGNFYLEQCDPGGEEPSIISLPVRYLVLLIETLQSLLLVISPYGAKGRG